MSNPVRFDGQWANGRRIDPVKTRPFKSSEVGLAAVEDWANRLGGFGGNLKPRPLSISACGSRKWTFQWSECVYSVELFVHLPSNWEHLAHLLLGISYVYRRGFENDLEMDPLSFAGEVLARAEHLAELLRAHLGDPVGYEKCLQPFWREWAKMRLAQGRVVGDPLPYADNPLWLYVDEADKVGLRIPARPKPDTGSALGEILGYSIPATGGGLEHRENLDAA